jgi:hypothetical protein
MCSLSTREKLHAFERELSVLNAGSNLRVSGLPTDALVELARIARQRGVRLEIKCGLSHDSMVEIAEAGGENVLLDVSDYA